MAAKPSIVFHSRTVMACGWILSDNPRRTPIAWPISGSSHVLALWQPVSREPNAPHVKTVAPIDFAILRPIVAPVNK